MKDLEKDAGSFMFLCLFLWLMIENALFLHVNENKKC